MARHHRARHLSPLPASTLVSASIHRHMDCLMQVPCPPDDSESPLSKKARADAGQWQQQQSKATANQQRQQAQQQQQQQAAAKRQSKDTNLVDMHQFWKYFHLVPAQVQSHAREPKCGTCRVRCSLCCAHVMSDTAYLVCRLCAAQSTCPGRILVHRVYRFTRSLTN